MSKVPDIKYGGDGLGIGEKYPVETFGTPETDGKTIHSIATKIQLEEAGFENAKTQPNDTPLHDPNSGEYLCTVGETHSHVLRNSDEDILAVWSEGRWWSKDENNAFTATLTHPILRMMAEATNGVETAPNRAARRGRK